MIRWRLTPVTARRLTSVTARRLTPVTARRLTPVTARRLAPLLTTLAVAVAGSAVTGCGSGTRNGQPGVAASAANRPASYAGGQVTSGPADATVSVTSSAGRVTASSRRVRARSSASPSPAPTGSVPQGHPQVIEPVAGEQATVAANDNGSDGAGSTGNAVASVGPPSGGAATSAVYANGEPIGDPNAHAPSLTQVKKELHQELVVVRTSSSTYIDPVPYVNFWERTDQGVDASLPIGAPIVAPCEIKILAIVPNWYAGQPMVYFELLQGPDAGKVQYVAEEITDIAPPGSYLSQGQVIARYAPTGTGIEYGWATMTGETLAREETGYFEGVATPAGRSMRAWLNSVGANAGPG